MVLVLLSACGPATTNDDDRQFASRTQTPRPSAAAPRVGTPSGTPSDGLSVETAATPDPADLLASPATASAAFFAMDGRLVVAHVDGRLQNVTLPGPLTALSVAPNGTTAAVLVDGTAGPATPGSVGTSGRTVPEAGGTSYSIVIVDTEGKIVRSVDDVLATIDAQPEVATALATEVSIATIALGPTIDDLIVAFPDGLLVRVPQSQPATVIPGSGNLADVQEVAWSPTGKGLVIIAADPAGGLPGVYHAPLRADGIDPVRIAPAPGRTTDDVAWLPDSSGVLFTDAAGPLDEGSLRAGRDLFMTPLRSDRRTLVAAAGVIGPAAGVVDFAVAPGGGSVAYTLYRSEGDQVRFNSLWVGATATQGAVRIQLPDDMASIDGLAWTSSGLLVLAQPQDGAGPKVLLVGTDGVAAMPVVVATPIA